MRDSKQSVCERILGFPVHLRHSMQPGDVLGHHRRLPRHHVSDAEFSDAGLSDAGLSDTEHLGAHLGEVTADPVGGRL